METQQYVSFFITVGVDVAVNNVKVFTVATKMQEWVRFARFTRYRIFHTAVVNST